MIWQDMREFAPQEGIVNDINTENYIDVYIFIFFFKGQIKISVHFNLLVKK